MINATIREVCGRRGWGLLALDIRTEHLHSAVTASHHPPGRLMNDLRACCTRRMVEAGLIAEGAKVWSHHGGTRWLNSLSDPEMAIASAANEQSAPPPMQIPPGWKATQEQD